MEPSDSIIMNPISGFNADAPRLTKKTRKIAKIVKQARQDPKLTINDSSKNYIIRLIEKKRIQKN